MHQPEITKDYIPALEGMRSLAVLGVLLFHLEVYFFGGGFLGVDLFFVISGFIITRNILFDVQNNRFSLKDFYYRRFRRILPALIATTFVTLLVAFVDVQPNELVLTAKSAIYSLFSLGNINFWLESGYFDSSAQTKPLLHTWSLSVEEQFYILWPSLLLLAMSFRGRVIAALVLLLTSLALSRHLENAIPEGVFYLLPFRVHQFMAGALIAILALRATGGLGNAFTLVGSGGLIWGFCCLTGETSPFSSASLITACGFLVILARESKVATMLYGNAVMQWLGTRSYALYLVHWPLIVLFKYRYGFELTVYQGILLGIGSILLAVVLHELVEKPFRKAGPDFTRVKRAAMPLSFAALFITLLMAACFWWMDGIPQRTDREKSALIESAYNSGTERKQLIRFGTCHLHKHSNISAFSRAECATPQRGKFNVLVIGDSLAADIYMMLQQSFPRMHIGQATAAGCPPLRQQRPDIYDACSALNTLRFNELVRDKVDIVVLAARWRENQTPRLLETTKFLKSIGREVLVFGPRLVFPENVRLLVGQQNSLEGINERLASKADIQSDFREQFLKDLAETSVVDPVELQCAPLCDVIDNDAMLYVDNHHFTPAGARLFGQRFKNLFDLRHNRKRPL